MKSDKKIDYKVSAKWSPLLADGGHVPIVTDFLKHYHELEPESLNYREAMFVIHLMGFKWTEENPHPGYKKLAKQMGVSDKTTRRLARKICKKGLLKIILREANTNEFDLKPLFEALENHKTKSAKS